MEATWRLAPWNDWGGSGFELSIEGDAAVLEAGTTGLALRFPYKYKTIGDHADPGELNARLLTLEGWIGHQTDGICLTLRIPSQVVMPNGHQLTAPVSQGELAALDAKRGTDALNLNILLLGTGRIPVPGTPDPGARNKHGILVRPELSGEIWPVRTTGNTAVNLTIGREQWLKILGSAGPRRFRLIELPIPVSTKLATTVDLLEQASVLMRRGSYSDAVAKARLVVEGVLVETARHWGIPRPNDGHAKWCEALGRRLQSSWPSDPESGLLFGRLLAAAWSWTSEDHHYSPTITSKRTEAEFAIGLASDALLLVGELISAHPQPLQHGTTTNSTRRPQD
jgi:hypothetical protein